MSDLDIPKDAAWGEKYYALYKGDRLICVTVYKKGAVEVMKMLSEKETKGGDEG